MAQDSPSEEIIGLPRLRMQAKRDYSTPHQNLPALSKRGSRRTSELYIWAATVRDTLRSVALCMRLFETMSDPHGRRRRFLQAVASLEFIKGVFVLAMGVCALALVHKDLWLYAESLLALLHINTDRHFAQVFLDFADGITDARLWAAARIAFAYAALRFTEAYGLWRCRTWAEWVALVSGTLLMPLEIRELFRGITLLRSFLFIGNLAIVFYMLYVILVNRRERLNAALPKASPDPL
jgi:uncharacterized membrane protein (DUF2068 family)